MKKGKIVIASVLKPIDDTRLFEKFGISLSQTNKYDVNIIGFYSKKTISYPNISFHPVFNFNRTSIKRFFVSWKYYKTLLKVKPDIIIVSSPDLLIVSTIFKILFGTKLSYDVQENYFNNIYYTKTYPSIIKTFLAYGVRVIEMLTYPFIDLYILAETCYEKEIPFIRNKSVIVQNKFRPLKPIKKANSLPNPPVFRFLYTGTITESYGILEAVNIANIFSKTDSNVTLRIVGHCPKKALHEKLKKLSIQKKFIRYEGAPSPVPHQQIIEAISEANFALLPYKPDKSTENCFPTKIWEYMAHNLPMIIQNHKPWVNYCKSYSSCIAIDFNSFNIEQIKAAIRKEKFYPNPSDISFFWESEELTFLQAINKLDK